MDATHAVFARETSKPANCQSQWGSLQVIRLLISPPTSQHSTSRSYSGPSFSLLFPHWVKMCLSLSPNSGFWHSFSRFTTCSSCIPMSIQHKFFCWIKNWRKKPPACLWYDSFFIHALRNANENSQMEAGDLIVCRSSRYDYYCVSIQDLYNPSEICTSYLYNL